MGFNRIEMEEKRKILERYWKDYLISVGLPVNSMSEKAVEYMTAAMNEYTDQQLAKFCDHLGKYEGLQEHRFDFMLIDFKEQTL